MRQKEVLVKIESRQHSAKQKEKKRYHIYHTRRYIKMKTAMEGNRTDKKRYMSNRM